MPDVPAEPSPTAPVTVAEPAPATPAIIELAYRTRDWTPAARTLTPALYEPYEVQSLIIDGARTHPTKLVQSGAMASMAPPKPGYRPKISPTQPTQPPRCFQEQIYVCEIFPLCVLFYYCC